MANSLQGYSITLASGHEVVARVARRFMPRLKTESEIATMQYFRERTNIPVPDVYHYDANPWNRLGGEYIIMSKAKGIPLASVFHSMCHSDLLALMENTARIMIPLFAHRFPRIGSLYLGPDANRVADASTVPTPTVTAYQPHFATVLSSATPAPQPHSEFHVGPIVSWPFFGSHRGELAHPSEIDRGPWRSTDAYLRACAAREVAGVIRENEGRAAPHRLSLDPGEVAASRHHHVEALSGDESDTSEEWDWEESEGEGEGPGDSMYRDYRRMQRTTFLVSQLREREEMVKKEMGRVVELMERLGVRREEEREEGEAEEFGIDCHDLSLENVFVDEQDHSKIACIIDWEATTTRPLWACAHVPTFLQSSPFTAKIFRATVEKLAQRPWPALINGRPTDLARVAGEWLHHEAGGARLRMAHRCLEWDGWEEGLVESILGAEEEEDKWFKSCEGEGEGERTPVGSWPGSPVSGSPTLAESASDGEDARHVGNAKGVGGGPGGGGGGLKKGVVAVVVPGHPPVPLVKKVVEVEKEREKELVRAGDICGGRGGELGRRLEAWLHVSGDGDGRVGLERRWEGEE
ncbi:uncharacterized protein LAESUDRAFT_711535 [Laetiporus sulphureus 93-53]|uniref:Uncharacterized protein n=1 Tax=Laetiporus sulphureus 93-53 TaxID=1314785 RepID=A0A165GGM1_9APHY|nr:uncharacterized protein LAESUDRAFT_711535 [Laetiporus sulphureus 93-53]KZT10317.1 hypothetical protein LAESUDRAFT_711535 [Laetiporus sulphureus 93-53]